MSVSHKLPFEQINQAALAGYPALLSEWLPGGVVRGKEFQATNPKRLDNHLGSFSVNVRTGKWSDFATESKGGDPISLYAYLFCDGDRVRAARELGARFGLVGGQVIQHPRFRVAAQVQAAEQKPGAVVKWEPAALPPFDAPPPPLDGWDAVYRYRDSVGATVRFVVRRDARNGRRKQILPLTWGFLQDEDHPDGVLGWHFKHPGPGRGLYGLERIGADCIYIVVEGEKAADRLRELMPDRVVLSWSAGTNAVDLTDWTPLADRQVLVWPDADEPGVKAAEQICAILEPLGCVLRVVDTSGLEAGWDAADAVAAGWDRDRLQGWLRERIRHPETLFGRPAGAADGGDDPEARREAAAPAPAPAPAPVLEIGHGGRPPGDGGSGGGGAGDGPGVGRGQDDEACRGWIVPLGHNNGVCYYLSRSSSQVRAIPMNKHTKGELIGLAPLVQHWERTRFQNSRGGVAWDAAGDALIRACEAVGMYRPERVRAAGAWLDGDRAVLHLGEHLVIDGDAKPLDTPGLRHVYTASPGLAQEVADPLSTAEAHKLLDIVKGFRWERSIDPELLVGWLVTAPVCGALKWRPNIWIAGGSGAGKTTLMEEVMAPTLGGMALRLASTSTEAGVRQDLDNRALPVLFDEAEAESISDKARMQSVLNLVRQSASDSGAAIVKGSQRQEGAKVYRLRSSFCFSSINVAIEHLADESRITVLSLLTNGAGTADEREAWRSLNGMIKSTLTPAFSAGLLARTVRHLGTLRRNAETFAIAVAEHLGSARVGDQIGTLLAGAYLLHSTKLITLEDARAFVAARPWSEVTSADAARDEERLLERVMQSRVRMAGGVERSLGEMVAIASGEEGDISAGSAAKELERNGIKYQPPNIERGELGGVWISNTHSALRRLLEGSAWSSQWARALKRLPGAVPSPNAVWFGYGAMSRAVFVPIGLLGRDPNRKR